MRQAYVGLAGLALLAGCSVQLPDLFGGPAQSPLVAGTPRAPAPEPVRLPVRRVEAERALRGVIVMAEAVAPVQGYHDAALVALEPEGETDGIMRLELRAIPPAGEEAVGPEQTRRLLVPFFLPDPTLRKVRGLQVNGAPVALPPVPPRVEDAPES